MKKESKNTGITKACPNCRKILIKSGNFAGTGSFYTKCPHCKTIVLAEIKPSLTLTKVVVAGLLFLMVLLAIGVVLYGSSHNIIITVEQQRNN